MEYAAHEAFLDSHIRDSKGKSMGTQRENYVVAARSSMPAVKARALKALDHGPEKPSSVAYLYDWSRNLFGKSGLGEAGFAPLTYTTVKHWADLTGNEPEPHEVEVLFWLDAIMLNPPKDLA